MEEYLGVNGRQLFVREHYNLEQCECVSLSYLSSDGSSCNSRSGLMSLSRILSVNARVINSTTCAR